MAKLFNVTGLKRHLSFGIGLFGALGEGTIDGAVSAVLDRDDGCHLPWRRAIDFDLDPQWALDLTNRFAAARARRWFPSFIGWILEGLAAGRPLSWVACEIAWALDQIRPIVEAEGRS